MGAFAGGSAAELPSLEEELAQVFFFFFLGDIGLTTVLIVGAIAAAPSEATTGVHNKCPKWGGDLTFLHLHSFWNLSPYSSHQILTQVSNTSMGTDTDTQFLMSSDSGSKVQVR